MKTFTVRSLLAVVAVCLATGFAAAQNRERFGISAQAGGVNAVSGEVLMKRKGQEPKMLTSQDDLASGDIVDTSRGSQAEILLNPGTYLRLAEASELVLVDNSLDNLEVRLNRGSAIIEATGPDQMSQNIPVVTDQGRLTIVRAGIYRINALPGVTELLVQKGRVRLDNDPQNIVKGGKKVTIRGLAPASIAKITKEDRDDFDDWSKERGKNLARANSKLSDRALLGYGRSIWGLRSLGYARFGVWSWSPFARCYTFLPFSYGWGSPYGSWYGSYAFGGFYGGRGYYGGSYYPTGSGNSGSITSGSAPAGSGGTAAPSPMSMPEFKSAPPQTAPQPVFAPAPHGGQEGRIKTPDRN